MTDGPVADGPEPGPGHDPEREREASDHGEGYDGAVDDADDQTDGEGDPGLTPGDSSVGDSSAGDSVDHAGEVARKRRLAQVFGDVLPEATQDERSGVWGDREGGTDDDWFRRQVPPHHG